MPHTAAARTATREKDAGRYQRHRPEQTLLYQIVEAYYPAFTAHLTEQDKELPGYVQREFGDYLRCGRLEHGILRVRCECCHAEHLVAHIWSGKQAIHTTQPRRVQSPLSSDLARR